MHGRNWKDVMEKREQLWKFSCGQLFQNRSEVVYRWISGIPPQIYIFCSYMYAHFKRNQMEINYSYINNLFYN